MARFNPATPNGVVPHLRPRVTISSLKGKGHLCEGCIGFGPLLGLKRGSFVIRRQICMQRFPVKRFLLPGPCHHGSFFSMPGRVYRRHHHVRDSTTITRLFIILLRYVFSERPWPDQAFYPLTMNKKKKVFNDRACCLIICPLITKRLILPKPMQFCSNPIQPSNR